MQLPTLALLLSALFTLSTACLTFEGTFYPSKYWVTGTISDNGVEHCKIAKTYILGTVNLSCNPGFGAKMSSNWKGFTIAYTRKGETMHFDINQQMLSPLNSDMRIWARNYGC